uniref:Uncharacterized protein n=1 Tax=Ascaris lumbricoides TaxID=6252 RepID=A0A0M3IM40_ASCLU
MWRLLKGLSIASTRYVDKNIVSSGVRPHAVAWEVRKTMSPPGKPNVDGPSKDAETLINMLTLSPVVVQEVVKNAEEKLSAVSQYPLTAINESMDDKENQQKKTTSIDNQEPGADDGWSLVTTRNKRRKSSGGQSSTSSGKRPICSAPPVVCAFHFLFCSQRSTAV